MKTKVLEIRDRGTFIPALAVRLSRDGAGDIAVNYLARRSGYGDEGCVLLTHLGGGKMAQCDPYAWNDRTWHVAHLFITDNWEGLKNGDVIDVEYILAETKTKKTSEYFTRR